MADTSNPSESNNSSTPPPPTDPSNFLNPPKLLVKVVNTGRQDLNGQFGEILSYNADRDRYTVSMTLPSSRGPASLSFKPENLARATLLEKMQHGLSQTRRRMEETSNDPQVREAVRRAYTSIQNRLPPGIKPEYLLYGILFGLIFSVRSFGLSKTVLCLSLATMPVVIVAPDLQAGADRQLLVRNFPRRVRENIVQVTGYNRISEKMALAAFVLMYLFSAKILMTPYASAKVGEVAATAATTAASSSSSSSSSFSSTPVTDSVGSSFNIDAIYRMGFEDGSTGKPYGTSLPDAEPIDLAQSTPRGLDSSDDIDWQYNPPPVPTNRSFGSKVGIGTVMSMFALFRTVNDLARGPDGRANFDVFRANVQTMETWRLGLLGLCVYNLLRVFW